MEIEKNVGGYDRIARAILGPVLVVVALAGLAGLLVETTTALMVGFVVVLVVGAILGVTAYTQECIVNQTLGINTLE